MLFASIADRYDFYGKLAAEELGRTLTVPQRSVQLSEAELAEPARNAGLARALKFYELGLRFEGNREWNFQLRGLNDRQLLAIAEWAHRRNVLDRAVNTADRTREQHDFALRFVTPFSDRLNANAAERELDPAWVYGLIRQESRFIMDARSSAGASGLMQLMPATARWVARKMGMRDFTQGRINDLETNLQLGTFYLRAVLDDLDGSPLLASAAYNAGPGRPKAWRSTLERPVEGAIFAETIPFTETRGYVKAVLSNATIYAAMFTGQPQSLKSRLGLVQPRQPHASELP
ncbi:MAG TPA: transglycosylase SLT domain-containing protein [Burkholderiaceae bacterium]|nr:transglycosylase SLT domain-containing protein [Burkholderiaceae bacterium]